MNDQMNEHHGGCLCGAVTYTVRGALRDVMFCHCRQCQKTSGHYFAATSAPRANLTLTGERGLKWYRSSDWAERGFCGNCGSSLFWRMNDSDSISILAGSLDGKTGLATGSHIFVADKKDYYEITDGLPQYDSYPGAPETS
ncbi:GFA family protein [Sneathiella sp.]|uniref:GFA family protein n=1 Tax=Sneathiella sp. TaxID=1964365 RepID=UPI0035689CE4